MKSILVADDDPTMVTLLTHILSAGGYEVAAVFDGRTALEYARTHRPDLAILDMHMPGMDGAEVVRQLRTGRERSELPVILLSGGDPDEHRRILEGWGGVYPLEKPFDIETLTALVRNLTGGA